MFKKIVEHQLSCIYRGFSVNHDGSIIFSRKKSIIIGIAEKGDIENTA